MHHFCQFDMGQPDNLENIIHKTLIFAASQFGDFKRQVYWRGLKLVVC